MLVRADWLKYNRTMKKELIRKRFAKSLPTYEKSAIVQEIMADNIIKALPERKYTNILELGCGCGLLTKKIVNSISHKTYDAVDMVEECEKYLSQISSDINFIVQDLEQFSTDKKYDLIISNASFQWLENLPEFIKNIKNYLKKDGIFVFTIFGKENYKEITKVMKTSLKYYSSDEIRNICSDYEIIKISDEIKVLNFDSPIDVLHHIKNTGVNALSQTHWTKSDLQNFSDEYNSVCGGNITLTYNPVYVVLKR